jgi:DNA-binding beta-propeller fold protein YncE
MKKISAHLPLLILIFISACNQTAYPQKSPTQQIESPQDSPTPEITLTTQTAVPEPSPSATSSAAADQSANPAFLRQGAAFSQIDLYALEEVATGKYQADAPFCGDTYLTTLPEESGEILLTLHYSTPVLAKQVEIFASGEPVEIEHIELLNSQSGLGKLIYESGSPIRNEPLSEGACQERLIFPADTDFEVDTIFIAFEQLTSAAQISAVEMTGLLEDYVEVPVFWRVPLPGTPVDMAAGKNGTFYVATEPKGLFIYDVEGNQLKQFSTPDHSQLASVTADTNGNPVVTDIGFQWFIALSPEEGIQTSVGGLDSYFDAAVNPLDGLLYLRNTSTVDVFTLDTAELVRKMPLDELHSLGRLAFNPQGQLFALRDYDWDAHLVELDPLTLEELDATPLERTQQVEIVARDLAIDASGNFYVLFQVNAGQIAVHMLDSDGDTIKRFGKLSNEVENWPEGEFLDPRAIAVSPDGRFILIADGYEESSYLTAFLVEEE